MRRIALTLAAGARTCGATNVSPDELARGEGLGAAYCRFFSLGAEWSFCSLFRTILLPIDSDRETREHLARLLAHDLGVSHRWSKRQLSCEEIERAIAPLLPPVCENAPPAGAADAAERYAIYQQGRAHKAPPPLPRLTRPPDRVLRCQACMDADAEAMASS